MYRQLGWLCHATRQRSDQSPLGHLHMAVGADADDAQNWHLLGRCLTQHGQHASAYDALQLQKGVVDTFFTPDTPFAILRRLQADGAADLVAATSRWKPWLPPKADQGLQQGGAFVFEGERLLFQHRDPSTGAHADLNTLLRVALEA